jgi:hypothetical protein
MIPQFPLQEKRPASRKTANPRRVNRFHCAVTACAIAAVSLACTASAQITVNTKTGTVTNDSTGKTASSVDRRYQQITPTKVPLTKTELDPKTRLDLMRTMQAEQGFAMRPFPRGHKGLTLAANGNLEPAGDSYVAMATTEGLCAKPGDRVVLTDVKIDRTKIIFDLNGGPDPKHRFLRHVQIGMGPDTNPVIAQGNDAEPVGARLTLAFHEHVPELTGAEVKALLAPLISFDVKTPIQAFTDTLPGKLKDAILNHQVLVGMSTDMVLFAMGQPDNKSREMEGQMPFEEWIYGKPPKDVQFVRINGNRVIRLEVAKVGESPVIFTRDEVEGLMRTDGTPLEADRTERVAKVGDVQRDPDTQAPAAPPSLRNPGEKLPSDTPSMDHQVVMRPVQPPKSKPELEPGANPDGVPDATPAANTQPAPADGSQPATQPATQPPAAKPQMLQSTVASAAGAN